MSINNMSDEELDNLFRNSAESFDPPFDPEAWPAMAEKLDSMPAHSPWWYKLFFPLVVLIYTCSIVTVTQLAQSPASASEKPEATVAAHQHQQNSSVSEITAGSTSTPESKPDSPENTPSQVNTKTVQLYPKDNVDEGKYLSGKKINTETDKVSEVNYRPTYEAGTDTAVTAMFSGSLQKKLPQQHSFKTLSPLPIQKPRQDSTLQLTSPAQHAATRKDSSTENREIEQNRGFLKSMQLAVLVAPDVTTVRFKHADAISANIGVVLGVPLSGRFSLVTGMIWADKVYGAKPEDYAPSPDYWSGKPLPSTIEAVCRVLDIPLNLQYKLLNKDKDVVALQAGLSTYIMLKEEYTYNYTYSSKPYSKKIAYSNESRHLFAVQNLSVSYSRKISPALSVGIEPFIKIPLTGIGTGNVKLTSAGLFLSAGYTFKSKEVGK